MPVLPGFSSALGTIPGFGSLTWLSSTTVFSWSPSSQVLVLTKRSAAGNTPPNRKYTAHPEIHRPTGNTTHPPTPCPRSWLAWLLLLHQVSAQRSHDQKGLHWPASSRYPHSLFEHPSRCFKVYNKYCSGNILVGFFFVFFFFILILLSCYNLSGKLNLGAFWVPFMKNSVRHTAGVP